MPTITIPKNLPRSDKLVAVPDGLYQDFLAWLKGIKSKREYIPTAAEKRALARARKSLARGN